MKKAVMSIAALSLVLAGCSSLERAILHSDIGKEGAYFVQNKYMCNFGKQGRIETYGLESKDYCPEKPILFFLHGWSGCLEEYAHEETGEARLDVMNEVFENRVIMADYPSSKGIDSIFSDLDNSFDNFVDEYSENNSGKKPKIIIAGHSLGSQLTRLFVRNHPNYFKKAGLIAGVSEGFDIGMLNSPMKKIVPRYLGELSGQCIIMENYQSILDLMKNSDFFETINTLTPELDTEYNFYILLSKKDNPFIPGKDDNVTRACSAYPLDLIKSKRFENVNIGDVIFYEGAVDHSLYNLELWRQILTSLKTERQTSRYAPSVKQAKHIIIPNFTEQEIQKKQREREIKKAIKINF
jgi:pimeloyl-ACP methyl ester carboxylesterase